jgi:putative transposase
VRAAVTRACAAAPAVRLNRVLKALGVARSVWYARRKGEPKRPGRKPKPVPEALAEAVRELANRYPWWGYKRIAVVARRCGLKVSNKQVYKVMKAAGLLQKRRVRKAELYQTARLFELLPKGPNELWQCDVTYIHIPGHGWWYAVTVIDYYSRYLLACHFTPSYRAADVNAALDAARTEAERWHGPPDAPDAGGNFASLLR